MQVLDTVIALAAVLALSVFLGTRRAISPAVAPLLTLALAMVWFTVGGLLGDLRFWGWMFYIGCFAALLFLLVVEKPKNLLARLASPGFVLFALLAVVALVYLAARQPIFREWDEYSGWGTLTKLVKLNDKLYTTAKVGWFWTSTEKPGLVMLGYFAQFLGGAFAPWKVYWGYDLLLFASLSALLAPFKRRDWRMAVPFAAVLAVVAFFFGTPVQTTYLTTVFISAYADLAAGLLFGGALAVYFTQRARGRTAFVPSVIILVAFSLVKDNVFPIVLVAAAIMGLDTLFCTGGSVLARLPHKLYCLVMFLATPLVSYLVWGRHAAWANSLNPNTGGAGTNMSPFAAVGPALAALFNPSARSEHFSDVLAKMLAAFTDGANYPVSMLGSGFVTVLFILGLFVAAALLFRTGRQRLRVALSALLGAAGFVGYQFVLLVSYVYIFEKNAATIPDYGRYLSSYYTGWFMLALCWFVLACAAGTQAGIFAAAPEQTARVRDLFVPHEPETGPVLAVDAKRRAALPVRGFVARCSALALAGAMLALFCSTVRPGYSVLDYPEFFYDGERTVEARAQSAAALLPKGARAFFVSQGDDGYLWFRYSFYLLPAILDYSMDGGTLAPPGAYPEGQAPAHYNPVTPAQLAAYLEASGCSYILIDALDEVFVESYGHLFSDGLRGADPEGGPLLYFRGKAGLYEPVVGEGQ